MPEIPARLKAACSGLFPGSGIQLDQLLGPDLSAPRARPRARDAGAAAPEPSRRGLAENGTHFAAADGSLADPAAPRCIPLHPAAGIVESQRLGPDLNPSRARPRAKEAARDARGRFVKGHSGNPGGRPPGIPQPRRRPLALLLRQARPGQLVEVFDRKPTLRLPLMNLLLPKARRPDPGELLRIDFSRLRSAAEIAAAMKRSLDAVCRGEITPGEGALLARRARKPLRALRRLMWREIALLKAQRRAAKRAAADPAKGPAASGGRGARGPLETGMARVAERGIAPPRPGPKPVGREQRRLRRRLARLQAAQAKLGPPACGISASGRGPPPDPAFRRHLSSVFSPARVDAGAANPILHRPGVRRLRFRDI